MTHVIPRVLCVGDVMVDVLARLPAPLEAGTDTPAPISVLGGGSAANTAAWLARAGVPTVLAGRVGDDVLGRHAASQLTDAGVQIALTVDPLLPTGVCIVLVAADGERTMVPAAGANEALAASDVGEELLLPGTRVHISAYPLLREATRDAVLEVLGRARSHGLAVSVDAASVGPLRDAGPKKFLDAIGTGVLIFANADEATVLTGHDDAHRAARGLAEACGAAIVKRGAQGAIWCDGPHVVEAATAAQVPLDTTGAGDAFAAGVLAGLIDDADIGDAMRRGCEVAAATIGTLGGRPAEH